MFNESSEEISVSIDGVKGLQTYFSDSSSEELSDFAAHNQDIESSADKSSSSQAVEQSENEDVVNSNDETKKFNSEAWSERIQGYCHHLLFDL